MIALIPARAGSQRIPGKNTKLLAGHPLIAYTIAAAQASGIFARIAVCSDDEHVATIAGAYDVDDYVCRPSVSGDQPDIVWVRQALSALDRDTAFAILRPTSPFRTADTIRRACREFCTPDGTHDSLRAVEPVTQHPGKMWTLEGAGYPIKPLLDKKHPDGTPWHSSPTQSLPVVYVQNACLEMGYTSNVECFGTVHGRKVAPFFTRGAEGIDLNTLADWDHAESLIARGEAVLPALPVARIPRAPAA